VSSTYTFVIVGNCTLLWHKKPTLTAFDHFFPQNR